MPNQREHQQQHSLAASLDNAEAQAHDQSMAAREQSIHQVGMEKKLENQHDLRQLNDQVKEMQQNATAKNESEVHELNNRQDLKCQELERVQVTVQPENFMVQKNNSDALEQFQRNQSDQLLSRQNLEQKVLKELNEAVEDLNARQIREQDELARRTNLGGSNVTKEVESQRQQLEARQQQERDQLNAYVDKQVQTLNNSLNDLRMQARQDEKAFMEALYRVVQDANQQNSLRDVLDKQQANQDNLERTIEERLFSAAWSQTTLKEGREDGMPNQREHQQQHSLAASLDNAEAQAHDQSMAAREQSIHQVGMDRKLENQHDLRQLNDQVNQLQQNATAKNENEVHELNNRQDLKRQELESIQATAQPQNAMAHKNEQDALEQFQGIQRDQLLSRQNLEQKVLKELNEAVEDLNARQIREQDELARRTNLGGSDVTKDIEQRQQQEAQQQQECDQLTAYVNEQVQTLKDYAEEIRAQASQDEKAFMEALYKTGQDANRQNSLRDVLDQQQANRANLERTTEERLFSAIDQRAFARRFSDTRTLKTLSEEATKNLDYRKGSDELANKYPILQKYSLDAEALERIVAKSNISHIKGQVLEELMGKMITRMSDAEKAALAGSKVAGELEFIPGHLITDTAGRQLTDGILAVREGNKLHVVTVFESKAGESATRGLSYSYKSLAEMSAKEQKEARAYAIDLLREKQPNLENVTSKVIEENYKQEVDEIMESLPKSEAGQLRRDIERLDAALIDDEKVELISSPKTTKLVAVLPSDVTPGKATMNLFKEQGLNVETLNMDITEQDLNNLAEEVAEAVTE